MPAAFAYRSRQPVCPAPVNRPTIGGSDVSSARDFSQVARKPAPNGLACHAGTLNATYPMIENATSAAANHAHTGSFDSMIGPPAASKRNRRLKAREKPPVRAGPNGGSLF
jgi:hypothetical protein